MTSCEIDLRVGGTWRYVMVANNEFEVAFHGEYREIVPDERIVSTEVYEGMPEDQQPEGDAEHRHASPRRTGARPSRCSCRPRARRSATRTSTPAWRPACRKGWTSWSRSRSRSAEQGSGLESKPPATRWAWPAAFSARGPRLSRHGERLLHARRSSCCRRRRRSGPAPRRTCRGCRRSRSRSCPA